jgi:hypothetical protein
LARQDSRKKFTALVFTGQIGESFTAIGRIIPKEEML